MLNRPYFVTIILALLIAIFHLYADSNSLYFTYKWLAIPMHVIGGFTIALLGVSSHLVYGKKIKRTMFWVLILLFTLLLGSFWEIYEVLKSVIHGVTYVKNFDLIDTVSDLTNDIIGAVVALCITHKKNWYA
jgi:hypothetical protein